MNYTTTNIEDHSRTIIHIDLDCFYAQVEMIKDPTLSKVPLGIQQKGIVVTSNYIAREYGVHKCMMIADAREVCPNLVLVKGEDLYDYRKVSYQVTTYLQRYSSMVERLGLDENFIDVSNLVNDRLCMVGDIVLQGHLFNGAGEECLCGCEKRLKVGSVIAQEMRAGLKNEFNLTSCAGIAHNKLLAKLVGSVHKPNQQTTIYPNNVLEFMLSLKSISSIPGVGLATTEALDRLNINSLSDLHACKFEKLKYALSTERAKWLVDLSYGIDSSVVKPSGKPQSIGLEDSCKSLNAEVEIKAKFQQLLTRLIILVSEDGRIPTTIKVTVRKFDSTSKVSHRETRQCNVSPNLFVLKKNTSTAVHLTEQSESKLLSIIMHLFNKLVNTGQPYHITLLGLSFTKFQERNSGRNSVASYFMKDVAVQSVTSIAKTETTSSLEKDVATTSKASLAEKSEKETEPLMKKSKLAVFLDQTDSPEYVSPSKLRVAELRLNSIDEQLDCSSADVDENNHPNHIQCPPNADKEVFSQLPVDVQRELWNEWKQERCKETQNSDNINKPVKKVKPNTILNYFLKN